MAKTYHFRVGNGDMALVETDEGRRVLIDINIRGAADDEDDDTPDVASQLRELLEPTIMIGMIMRDDAVIDPLEAGLLRRLTDPIRIAIGWYAWRHRQAEISVITPM